MSRPNVKTSSNPDLRPTSESDTGVTCRKRKQPECLFTETLNAVASELRNTIKSFREDVDASFATMNSNISGIKEDLVALKLNTSQIRAELDTLRSEHDNFKLQMHTLKNSNEELSQQFTSLQGSLQYTSDQCDELVKQMTTLERRVSTSSSSEELFTQLEAKIDTLEQQARSCNVEISNIPERRGENLITIAESIGNKIKFPITHKDIISIHRVPHNLFNKDKPKNIVIRFSSVIFRDNVISAYRLAKGLKSDQIGVTGSSHIIYLNEHLTLKKKMFFRECRLEAKKNNFKYCWIKHSNILVRKTDTSNVHAIRNKKDFSKFSISENNSSDKSI